MKTVVNFVRGIRNRNVVAVFILVSVLQALAMSCSTPVYTVFLLSFGITPVVMNRINTWFMVSNVALELPTGVLGDIYGYRKSVIWGLIFWALATLIYGISSNIPGFLLAETLAAVGRSFISGSFEAWMVNAAKEQQVEAHVNVRIVSRSLTVISLPVVTVVADSFGLQTPWFIGAVLFLLAAIAAWFLMIETVKPEASQLNFRTATIRSFKIVLGHPVARLLVLGSGLMVFAFQGLNMFWAPMFEGYFGIAPLGSINAGINVALMLGAFGARVWSKKHNGNGMALGMIWVFISLSLGLQFGNPSLLLVGFLLHEVGRGMIDPLFRKLLNEHVPDDIRASVLSVASMFDMVFAALGLELSGRLATRSGFLSAWWWALIPIALSALIFYLANRVDGKRVVE